MLQSPGCSVHIKTPISLLDIYLEPVLDLSAQKASLQCAEASLLFLGVSGTGCCVHYVPSLGHGCLLWRFRDQMGKEAKGEMTKSCHVFLKRKIIKWAWHSLIDLEGFRIPWPILSGSTNNLSLSSAPKTAREPEEEVKFCCILGIATQMSCRKLRLGRSDPALTPFPSRAPCASLLYVHIALCAPFPSAVSIAVLDAPSHHVTRDEGWNQDVSLGLVLCSGAQTPSPAVLLSNCIVLSESFQLSVPQFPCLWTRVTSVYLVGLLCGC